MIICTNIGTHMGTSWTTALLGSGIASSGTADSFLNTYIWVLWLWQSCSRTPSGTRWGDQRGSDTRYMIANNPTFQYWDTISMRVPREKDFPLVPCSYSPPWSPQLQPYRWICVKMYSRLVRRKLWSSVTSYSCLVKAKPPYFIVTWPVWHQNVLTHDQTPWSSWHPPSPFNYYNNTNSCRNNHPPTNLPLIATHLPTVPPKIPNTILFYCIEKLFIFLFKSGFQICLSKFQDFRFECLKALAPLLSLSNYHFQHFLTSSLTSSLIYIFFIFYLM